MLNVSFEFSFRPEQWKVPDTSDLNIIMKKCSMMSYHIIQVTCWRTNGKETKAYPIIRKPIHYVNWGLPKTECLKRLCVMPVKVINFKFNSKKDDTENPSWQRSVHSSQAG